MCVLAYVWFGVRTFVPFVSGDASGWGETIDVVMPWAAVVS